MWPSEFFNPHKILVIQTAFIGDVILATALLSNLKLAFPEAHICVLVRQGNESLLENNPDIFQVYIWDKKNNKWGNLIKLIRTFRKEKFDLIINLHRYLSSGIISLFSGAKQVWGFNKNPLSGLFYKKITHNLGAVGSTTYSHEVDRNNLFLGNYLPQTALQRRPSLYPSIQDDEYVLKWKNNPYITISPSSVWFTKQFPKERWVELINKIDKKISILLLGGVSDETLAEWIKAKAGIKREIINLTGKLSFLQSASVMRDSMRNYTNDSAPLHISSAMNAPTTAIYCSTIPEFGFGPLSDATEIWQVDNLYCRPCGLHGFKNCPEGHFQCAWEINIPAKL